MQTLSFTQVLDALLQREKTAEISTSPRTFFVHVRVPDHVVEDLRAVQKRVIPDASKHQDIDHVTLVYTKKPLEDHPPDKVHAALEALRQIGEKTEPVSAKIQGWGYFDGASKDGKTTTALVALLDAPGLEHLHVDMVRALKDLGVTPSDNHVFTPHITLGYLGEEGRVDTLPKLSGSFMIDKAHVASRDHHEIPLTGMPETVGQKAAAMAFHGSPTKGLETLEPRLDPRTGEHALFMKPEEQSALIYALLADRAKSNIDTTTRGGKFVSGHAVTPHQLLPEGFLYGADVPNLKDDMLRSAVTPSSMRRVTPEDARNAGWTWEEKAAASALRSRIQVVPDGAAQMLLLNGKQIGQMLVNHRAPVPAIDAVGIDPRFRGMGLGKKLYGDTMKQLGGRLHSGSMVSEDASRVWNSLARNPGYEVQANPTFPHPTGKHVSFDYRKGESEVPVFEGALKHLTKQGARAGMRQIQQHIGAGNIGAANRLATTPGVLKPSAAGSQIRQLGAGVEGAATLVAHPEHGVAVRKTFDPQGTAGPEMVANKAQVGRALQGNPNVARFLGETPTQIGPAHFSEYVHGTPTKKSPAPLPSLGGETPASHGPAAAAAALRSQGPAMGMHLHDVGEHNMITTPSGQHKVIDYMPLPKKGPSGVRMDVVDRGEAAMSAHGHGMNHAFSNYIADPARPGNLMAQAFRGAKPLVQEHSPPQNPKWASLGEEAAAFAMNPRDVQTQRRDSPGKGTTTPSIGGVPLQGSR